MHEMLNQEIWDKLWRDITSWLKEHDHGLDAIRFASSMIGAEKEIRVEKLETISEWFRDEVEPDEAQAMIQELGVLNGHMSIKISKELEKWVDKNNTSSKAMEEFEKESFIELDGPLSADAPSHILDAYMTLQRSEILQQLSGIIVE